VERNRRSDISTPSHSELISAVNRWPGATIALIYTRAGSDEGRAKVKRRTRGTPATGDEDITRDVIERKRK